MSKPISDPVSDIGRDLQRAYDEGYKQGRYDKKVAAGTSLPSGEQTHALRTETHACDSISRRDALKPFCITPDGTRIPEVDCDNFPVEFSVKDIKRHLLSLPPVEPKPHWIPIKWHTITEEEREREGYPKEWVTYLDCEMPADNESILVQTHGGYIGADVCYEDGEYSLDSGYDWIEDIVAWMPMPKPWKGADDET